MLSLIDPEDSLGSLAVLFQRNVRWEVQGEDDIKLGLSDSFTSML